MVKEQEVWLLQKTQVVFSDRKIRTIQIFAQWHRIFSGGSQCVTNLRHSFTLLVSHKGFKCGFDRLKSLGS